MNIASTAQKNADRLLLLAARAQEEADRMASLPSEPAGLAEDDTNVIFFEKQFSHGGTVYTYAAVKAKGLWYTTGPHAPKGYTWGDLMEWAFSDGQEPVIWAATEFETLNP